MRVLLILTSLKSSVVIRIPRRARCSHRLAGQVAPEDGCLTVVDNFDDMSDSIITFTRQGLEFIEEFLT